MYFQKTVIKFLFIIVVILPVFSVDKNDYLPPKQVVFNNKINDNENLISKIYPLGWSKDGKFAYCISYPNEAMSDGNIYNLIIQNLITDEIVYDSGSIGIIEELTKNGDENEKPLLEEDELSYIWYGHEVDFTKVLKDNGIIQVNFKKNVFPLKFKDDVYNASFVKKMIESDEGFQIISSFSLVIESQKKR